MPENSLERADFHGGLRPLDGILVEVASLDPALESRASDGARNQADRHRLVGVCHGGAERRGEADTGNLRLVEVDWVGRRHPLAVAVHLEHPRMGLVVVGIDLAATGHVRLADEQVQVETLAVGELGVVGLERRYRCPDENRAKSEQHQESAERMHHGRRLSRELRLDGLVG